ncbi:MAG: restriction endonuclease subunit S [Gammaproteobacteria bacterium]|nr:restriction endonuclease subunit S [Gammaproteobacteria bacterium]
MTDLPSSWILAPLENLIAPDGIFTDGDWVESKDQDPNGEVRLIQLADIADSRFLDKSSRFLTREKAHELNCTFLRKGDLMVARMPDPLGRCCIFPLDGKERFVTVVDVCAIRVGSAEIDPPYLMHAINSPVVRAQVSALQSGSTRKRISRRNLATVSVPVAPLNEQRRIVERIDALFDEIERGVESLRTARRMIDLYRQSLLKSAFEGRLTADWRVENADKLESTAKLLARVREERERCHRDALDEWERTVAEWKRDGENGRQPAKPKSPTASAAILDAPEDSGTPRHWLWLSLSTLGRVTGGLTKNQTRKAMPLKAKYLRVANVYSNRLVLDEIKEIGISEVELRRTRLVVGDLLFVEGNGSLEQIGRVAVWDGSIPNITHQNHLIRLRPNGLLSSRFALYFMISPIGRSHITAQASSTSGLHTLSISKVGSLPVPVCSRAEQAEVVRCLDGRFEAADLLLAEIDASLSRAVALRQSILKKAFAGQLVPQSPADEPAFALLARIRQELAAEPAKRRRRRAAIAQA